MFRTVAFLFREPDFDQHLVATVNLLLTRAYRNTCHLRLGSLLLHTLAEYTAQVAIFPKGTGKHSRYRSVQRILAHDMELYATLVWDLVKCIRDQWHTLDIEEFGTALGRRGLDAIVCSGITLQTAATIEKRFTSDSRYVGAFEIDLGNPVQRRVFVEGMIPVASVQSKELIVEENAPDDHTAPWWATQTDAVTLTVLDEFRYGAKAIIKYPPKLSKRGKATRNLARRKRIQRTSQRLLETAARVASEAKDLTKPVVIGLPDRSLLEDTLVAEAKMLKYVLSADHERGRHKARVFESALGITAKNWRYLAAQLRLGLSSAEIHSTRISDFGAQYSADIAVTGLDNRQATVRTGWVALGNEPPHLVTAYVVDATSVTAKLVPPPVLSEEPTSDKDWLRIFRLASKAGSRAAAKTVPTPMKIAGGELITEGECGYAWVVVRDARHAFVRWAKKTGKGHRHHPKGWAFPADTNSQSVDRARAYAQAFAEVLSGNGIAAQVESRLD